MSDLDDPLRVLFRDLAGQGPHDPDLATTIQRPPPTPAQQSRRAHRWTSGRYRAGR